MNVFLKKQNFELTFFCNEILIGDFSERELGEVCVLVIIFRANARNHVVYYSLSYEKRVLFAAFLHSCKVKVFWTL